jgi:hypothetical protein
VAAGTAAAGDGGRGTKSVGGSNNTAIVFVYHRYDYRAVPLRSIYDSSQYDPHTIHIY